MRSPTLPSVLPPALALALALALAPGLAAPAAAETWETHVNPVYGFRLEVPDHLFDIRRKSRARDSVQYDTYDGDITLLAAGSDNLGGLDTHGFFEDRLAGYPDREVTYSRVTGDWLVLSGYLDPDRRRIFYERYEIAADGSSFSGFQLVYDAARRPDVDDLIGRIGRSLTPPR